MSAPTPAPAPTRQVFRLPRSSYLVVVFLLFGAIPLAFTTTGDQGASAEISVRTLVILIPIVVAVLIARTATIVTKDGIVVRAAFGRRGLPWNSVRGLSVTGRSVYAVRASGSIRLPCVRVADLATVARASGGRLPELADATPKYAPSRRRRR